LLGEGFNLHGVISGELASAVVGGWVGGKGDQEWKKTDAQNWRLWY
jgi:hypothetical protein